MANTPLAAGDTALLLVDLQNDNAHPEGAFASFGAADHAREQGLVSHVRQLLEWARSNSMPVIHNRIVFYPGGNYGGTNAPIFRMIGPESLKLGSWGADALEGLEALPDEPVLIRNRMSSFNGTGLDVLLRNSGVSTVIVAGVWTNMAVEHTVRDAADHGYRAVLVTDATSSINGDWHEAALSYALTNIAELQTTAEITGSTA
ncbi:cysteine hydrolase [Arthrobacter sp. DNA4]|uniref:cysteine hydrolase family protein n=1 Tax=Micrococcaceae TaxID=1268 RepID=UPI0020CBC22F|nr:MULTISPECIES: cysteine hydrolase [Micrococcaceae]UTT71229.1 cysteine hydrolase [Arthrobacter sp. DNA4]WRT15696.1 cysteine hydrolase [Pseudarthrobacter sp. LT1]